MIGEENLFVKEEYRILKRIPKTTLIIALILSVGSFVLYSFLTSIIVLLGGFVSILNFLWLKKSIIKLTSVRKKKALIYGISFYFIRVLLIFICFFIIIKISSESLLGFAVGFFSIFLAMVIEFIINLRKV